MFYSRTNFFIKGYLETICSDKLANCAEFDSGDLCTNPMYNAWRYENCGAYCKLDICNSNGEWRMFVVHKIMLKTWLHCTPIISHYCMKIHYSSQTNIWNYWQSLYKYINFCELIIMLTNICVVEKLCTDSTNVDCQLLNNTIDLCASVHKAKTICRKYCSLCDLSKYWFVWLT